MLNVERISVMNMENAIRGARNPMNSWAKIIRRILVTLLGRAIE